MLYIFCLQLWMLCKVHVTTTETVRVEWKPQPDTFENIANVAYGVVDRTLLILGGRDSSGEKITTSRTFDLDSLTFNTLTVYALEGFELWSK